MWDAAAATGRRRHVLRTASTTLIAVALLVPAVGRSDADRNGPSPPTALAIVAASSTSLTMTWEAGHGGPAQEFALFRNGQRLTSTAETSYTFAGLSCDTTYMLEIEAFDAAGNRSDQVSIPAAADACQAPATTPPPATHLEPGTPVAKFTWAGAGAFVWHETDVAPETLGLELRANGFTWVALLIHDGVTRDPIEGDWVQRLRAASGLSVGGWGVLRTEPEREAELAHRLLHHYRLDFYIANAETEYKFSNDDDQNSERFGRTQRFVERFRVLEPETPAALSSYCRADRQDIDWKTWGRSGFAFLPQAYVNDFGSAASPAACAEGASEFFPASAVHPTIGVYTGQDGEPSPERYAALLDEAGTVGFSVYLAETRMYARDWNTFGKAIAELKIADVSSDAQVNRAGPSQAR